jgi:type I restriction enzyme R subunit
MKQKNLAIELMNKLLKEEIKLYSRTALVKAEEFSKRMKKIMDNYRKNQIANAESLDEFIKKHHDKEIQKVLDDLIELAKDVVDADKKGEGIGLTKEETSFYYALTSPAMVKEMYADETLIEMARELTSVLKENESIDWQYKQSGRARMRTTVRRLLRKYDYPPKEIREALEIVLKQCEHWTERRI